MMIGLLAYGAYVPSLRLQRSAIFAANSWFAPGTRGLAKGERAIAGWDEDSITMAVEAARDCLEGVDRAEISRVLFASTTAPFADRQNAGIVKEALDLNDAVGTVDIGGSQKAGTSALLQAFETATASGRQVLCLASDLRKALPASEGEMYFGDGASALLIGQGNPIARLVGSHSVSIDFVDHFRERSAEFDYSWESRWVRDEGYIKILAKAVQSALESFAVSPDKISHMIVPIAVKGVSEAIAKKAGVASEAVCDTMISVLGDTGAAHASLMLVRALENAQPGDHILVTSFGQGCDVLLFEVTDAIRDLSARKGVSGWLARGKADSNYMRYLFSRGLLEIDRGMRAEFDSKQPLTALYRNRRTVMALVGGRCTRTGTIQYPKTDISVNQNDPAVGTQEDYPLAEKKVRVVTFTADRLGYSPNPPLYYGMIEFEGGGRMMADFTDCDDTQVKVGAEMRMMFRVKSFDELRGFRRYFWKAMPV